jgi:hypothetical protein
MHFSALRALECIALGGRGATSDSETSDAETGDAETSDRGSSEKRCRLDANFFYILSRENLIVHTLRKRETKKRVRKRTKKKQLNY